MKLKFKILTALACLALFVSTASAQLGKPAVAFSTESGTTTQLVTNKVIAYNVTATPNVPIDCTKGENLFLQVRFRYTTTSIPSTNLALVFSCAAEPNAVGSTNRHAPVYAWTVAGSTTDGGYATYTTNFNVLGRPYVYLDSVLPLAPLTNMTLKYYVK